MKLFYKPITYQNKKKETVRTQGLTFSESKDGVFKGVVWLAEQYLVISPPQKTRALKQNVSMEAESRRFSPTRSEKLNS